MSESGPALDFAFPQLRRLSLSSDFNHIKQEGQRLVLGGLIANWLPNSLGYSRLGVITPAKIGKAHMRSHVRRLIRESFRLHQWELWPPVDLVVIARNSITMKPFSEVEANFLNLLKRSKLVQAK